MLLNAKYAKCGSVIRIIRISILRISADLDPRPNQTRPEPDSSVGSNRRMSTIRSLPSYTEPGRSPGLWDELSIYAAFTKRETLFRHVSSSDFPENLSRHLNQQPVGSVRLGHLTKRKVPIRKNTEKSKFDQFLRDL